MFGQWETSVCPVCGTENKENLGITQYYKIEGGTDEEFHRQRCYGCNTTYLTNGKNSVEWTEDTKIKSSKGICF